MSVHTQVSVISKYTPTRLTEGDYNHIFTLTEPFVFGRTYMSLLWFVMLADLNEMVIYEYRRKTSTLEVVYASRKSKGILVLSFSHLKNGLFSWSNFLG
jgi:hypothetical protein